MLFSKLYLDHKLGKIRKIPLSPAPITIAIWHYGTSPYPWHIPTSPM